MLIIVIVFFSVFLCLLILAKSDPADLKNDVRKNKQDSEVKDIYNKVCSIKDSKKEKIKSKDRLKQENNYGNFQPGQTDDLKKK